MIRQSIALVATPWKTADMPSLQLAVLATWLRERVPTIPVVEHHHYVEVAGVLGEGRYDGLAGLMRAGDVDLALPEAFYAALLFPAERERIAATIDALHPAVGVRELLAVLERLTVARARRVAAEHHGVVGLSVSFFQTFASLLFVQELKKADPDCLVVLGGPEVPGEVGLSLLRTFAGIDFIVGGEGETPIQIMAETLRDQPHEAWRERIASIDGVLSRADADVNGGEGDRLMPQGPKAKPVELRDLNDLPVPSFDAYFEELPASLGAYPRWLPVETSRGCFWDRSNVHPLHSCAFCNLNATWSGYREKSGPRASREMNSLRERYSCDDLMVVDNILRQGAGLEPYLDSLQHDNRGARMVIEAKSSLRPREFARLREVGVVEMQLGVEALANGILKRVINKGTTVLHNLQALRWMDDLGISHIGNLIINFPGTKKEDIDETLRNIELASAYQPLFPGEFWLGYYSPMYRVPEVFGLSNIRNHTGFDACLPEELRDRMFALGKDYDAETPDDVREGWVRVKLRMDLARLHYRNARKKYGVRSLLVMEDHGSALEILDYREDPPARIVLEGPAHTLYLRMTSFRTEADLAGAAGDGFNVDELLGELAEQRLVYREHGRALSLAVLREERVPPPYLDMSRELRSTPSIGPRERLRLTVL